jgi:urea transporter
VAMFSAARAVLRGIAQVFFIPSPWTGMVLLVALAVSDLQLAALVLLGSVVQTGASWLMGFGDRARYGMMGYNGALVGAAAALDLNAWAPAILTTLVGALACIPVHELVRRTFESPALRWAGLPVSTAPFCVVAGMLFGVYWPLAQPGAPTTLDELARGSVLGLFNNFSEVMLADSLLTGALILVALLIGSWRIGLYGLLGSTLAVLVTLALYESLDQISAGLLGYSAVLVAIAVGAVFRQDRPWWQRILGVVVGVALTLAVQPLLSLTPVPVYTWPFLISMWIVLLAQAAIERAQAHPAGMQADPIP